MVGAPWQRRLVANADPSPKGASLENAAGFRVHTYATGRRSHALNPF